MLEYIAELERIGRERQLVSADHDELWQHYIRLQRETEAAYQEMREAWNGFCKAKDALSRKTSTSKAVRRRTRQAYKDYAALHNGARRRGDIEHLWPDLDEVEARAQRHAPGVNGTKTQAARKKHEQMKGKYPDARSKYRAKKAERDRVRTKVEQKRAQLEDLRLQEARAIPRAERDRLLDQAGIDDATQRREAVVRKNDDFLHIYYGDGLGQGNWDGHGHVVINLLSGKVAYRRAPEPAPAPEPGMELAPNTHTA